MSDAVPLYPVHVRDSALAAIARYSVLSAATPLIPIPILDNMTVSAIQLAMLAEVSRLYGQDFSKNIAKSLVGAAGGGLLSFLFSNSGPGKALKSFVQNIPAVGPLLRWGTGPVVLAFYTYLLGMAFVHHFETGGKFADFDRHKFFAYVQRVLREPWAPRPFYAAN